MERGAFFIVAVIAEGEPDEAKEYVQGVVAQDRNRPLETVLRFETNPVFRFALGVTTLAGYLRDRLLLDEGLQLRGSGCRLRQLCSPDLNPREASNESYADRSFPSIHRQDNADKSGNEANPNTQSSNLILYC